MSYQVHAEYSLNTAEATTPEILYGDFEYGLIFVPAGSSITTLTFYAAPESGGTFLSLYDVTNAAVTMTVSAGRAYPIPAECVAAEAIKIVVDSAGDVEMSFRS